MAKKTSDKTEYRAMKRAVSERAPKQLYLFHGEERYLLEYYLSEIRKIILSGGFDTFNHKKFDGAGFTADTLAAAIDALPVFSERTLIEIVDFDLFRCSDDKKQQFIELFSDLPEYVCIVFIYDTIDFRLDSRLKLNQALKKLIHIVEFELQDQSDLVVWIGRRYKALGKKIDRPTAEYLAFVTGGFMTNLIGEIEKTAALTAGATIDRQTIDRVVTPVLDAVTYRLADEMAAGRFDRACRTLSALFQMREPPHKILYAVSQKMRQMLAARICYEQRAGLSELMDCGGIRYEFQARNLLSRASTVSAAWCRSAVLNCADTALAMNSSSESNEALLVDLLINCAVQKKQTPAS